MAQVETLHRCFYALRFEEPTITYLSSLIETLRAHGADVAWVREENLHLTLRFLGELSDIQLARALAAPHERIVDSFELAAQGLGAYPGLRNAKVIWAGVGSPTPNGRSRLEELQSHTEQWARASGIPPEHRRFRPHITLGRIRRPGDRLRELIDDITTRECQSPVSGIRSVVLLRSGAGGAYEEVGGWQIC